MTTKQKKRRGHASTRSLNTLLTSFVVAGFSSAALGNPTGATVVEGNAVVSVNGAETTVTTTTDRAIINWSSFSIGSGELTRFVMGGADRAVLNKVSGPLSQIDGSLLADGRVYLINPNGIVIGASGSVQTHSFIASTRWISDEDFMDGGTLSFSGAGSGEVHNLGTIQASNGDVALIGKRVVNNGSITASQGIVALAAGGDVMLAAPNAERLLVLVTGVGSDVDNTGVISAAQAELQAVGGNMYGLAVNAGGDISATGIANRNGRIYLTADVAQIDVPGTLTARDNDGSGGDIAIEAAVGFGSEVHVSGTLDVSSASTGGGVYIHSSRIELNDGARLLASGGSGNAGGVFVGSEENTNYLWVAEDAGIEAGSLSGDAGNVDLSGAGVYFHGHLQARGAAAQGVFNINAGEAVAYTGLADLRAHADDTRFGTVKIAATNANLNIDIDGSLLPGLIDVDALATQLNHGNVIVASGAERSIDVFAPISWQTSTRLTLQAGGNVDINRAIEASNGALHLISLHGAVSDLEPATITVRDLWLSAAEEVHFAHRIVAQNVTLYDIGGRTWLTNDANRLGTVTFMRDLHAQSGEVDIVDSADGLTLTTSNVGGLTYSTDGNFSVRTAGDLTLASAFQTHVAGDVTLVAAGGMLHNQSAAGASVFGTSASGLGRTRVYATGVGEHGGLDGPAHYNVSYSREHAATANTGFYYSGNTPQGPNPPDPDPVDPDPVNPNPPQPPDVPGVPSLPPSQVVAAALDGNSFEQLSRPTPDALSRLSSLPVLVPPAPPTDSTTWSVSDADQLEQLAHLAGLMSNSEERKTPANNAGKVPDKNAGQTPETDSTKNPPGSPQQIADELQRFMQQLQSFLDELQAAGVQDPERASVLVAKMLSQLSPDTLQLVMKNQLDKLPEVMAALLTQHALEQRNSALDERLAARDRAREQLQTAAEQIRASAAETMARGIVQAALQIAAGIAQSGSLNKLPNAVPTLKPPVDSKGSPVTPPPNIDATRPPQSPVVTPPISLPSAVQARLDAIEAARNQQNAHRPGGR